MASLLKHPWTQSQLIRLLSILSGGKHGACFHYQNFWNVMFYSISVVNQWDATESTKTTSVTMWCQDWNVHWIIIICLGFSNNEVFWVPFCWLAKSWFKSCWLERASFCLVPPQPSVEATLQERCREGFCLQDIQLHTTTISTVRGL